MNDKTKFWFGIALFPVGFLLELISYICGLAVVTSPVAPLWVVWCLASLIGGFACWAFGYTLVEKSLR